MLLCLDEAALTSLCLPQTPPLLSETGTKWGTQFPCPVGTYSSQAGNSHREDCLLCPAGPSAPEGPQACALPMVREVEGAFLELSYRVSVKYMSEGSLKRDRRPSVETRHRGTGSAGARTWVQGTGWHGGCTPTPKGPDVVSCSRWGRCVSSEEKLLRRCPPRPSVWKLILPRSQQRPLGQAQRFSVHLTFIKMFLLFLWSKSKNFRVFLILNKKSSVCSSCKQ